MGRLDPMRAFLKQHGAPPHVVEAGLPGLVALWEGFAHEVWRGYDLGLDDYLNDLDARTLIEACFAEAARDPPRDAASDTPRDAAPSSPPSGAGHPRKAHPAPQAEPGIEDLRARVAAADSRLRSATVTRKQCLWGEAVAQRRGWSAGVQWWYFRVPKTPGPALRDDLSLD